MKKLTFLSICLLITTIASAQMSTVKKFDFSILENKVLYIPKWSDNSKEAKRLMKKGKFEKLKTLQERVEFHNSIWTEAMALSAYDATPYEIRECNPRKLLKAKDRKAIVFKFVVDDYGNRFASLIVAAGPKKNRLIATTVINGLDLDNPADIRLMVNMLNHSMNTAGELQEEGKKVNRKGLKNKYKEGLIEFAENIDSYTFLAPKYSSKDYKKYEKKNKKVREAMKSWKLSEYEILPISEIEDRRANGDPNEFYWRSFPIFQRVGPVSLPVYSVNMFFTCDGDKVVYYFVGGKSLKASAIEKAQENIMKKAEKYKKQLSK